MSATGRGAERREHDFYASPAWCVDRLLDRVSLPPGRWLEPAVGDGAIVRAVNAWFSEGASMDYATGREPSWPNGPMWDTMDIRPDCGVGQFSHERHLTADFTWMGGVAWREAWSEGHHAQNLWDVIITNPPYAQALDFVRQSLKLAPVVAMLLRLNWLAGAERHAFLTEHPPDVYVLPNRPSFTGEGTDATDYAWMVWRTASSMWSPPKWELLDLTPKEERC